mmetsp:Transcript_56299/g.160305  ORF Transcript_56299/g.160305 Transcript_56299/m.160305 type:complete len:214 (+) Transcript_56299:150-791(+)
MATLPARDLRLPPNDKLGLEREGADNLRDFATSCRSSSALALGETQPRTAMRANCLARRGRPASARLRGNCRSSEASRPLGRAAGAGAAEEIARHGGHEGQAAQIGESRLAPPGPPGQLRAGGRRVRAHLRLALGEPRRRLRGLQQGAATRWRGRCRRGTHLAVATEEGERLAEPRRREPSAGAHRETGRCPPLVVGVHDSRGGADVGRNLRR